MNEELLNKIKESGFKRELIEYIESCIRKIKNKIAEADSNISGSANINNIFYYRKSIAAVREILNESGLAVDELERLIKPKEPSTETKESE